MYTSVAHTGLTLDTRQISNEKIEIILLISMEGSRETGVFILYPGRGSHPQSGDSARSSFCETLISNRTSKSRQGEGAGLISFRVSCICTFRARGAD